MIQASFSSPVNASLQTLWNLLLDKIENPGRYIAGVEESKILSRDENGVLREMRTCERIIKEKITVDEQAREVRFTLVDHPLFSGQVINKIIPPLNNHSTNPPTLNFTLNWEPANEEVQKNSQEELTQMIHDAVLHTKSIAEQQEG